MKRKYWVAIRTLSIQDADKLDRAARSFCKRMGYSFTYRVLGEKYHSAMPHLFMAVQAILDWDAQKDLVGGEEPSGDKRRWRTCLRRALHEPTADEICGMAVGRYK